MSFTEVEQLIHKVNIDEAVEAYLNLRNERERIKAEYEAQDEALKQDMAQIDEILLKVCADTNVNSFNTNHGTVIRQIKERYVCGDWDSFRRFELEHPEYDLRERRIHQGNFKTFMEAFPSDGLPPGVNSMREFQIVVRKAK